MSKSLNIYSNIYTFLHTNTYISDFLKNMLHLLKEYEQKLKAK